VTGTCRRRLNVGGEFSEARVGHGATVAPPDGQGRTVGAAG
jgi:hypothetical protein